VTVWGVADRFSWRGADQRADLLDGQFAPKPAYADVRCRLADPRPPWARGRRSRALATRLPPPSSLWPRHRSPFWPPRRRRHRRPPRPRRPPGPHRRARARRPPAARPACA
jgi:hypothetical protein